MKTNEAIAEIVETLDGFTRSMRQRQEWLEWARGKRLDSAEAMINHTVLIVKEEAEVFMMSSIITAIRQIVERIDKEEG